MSEPKDVQELRYIEQFAVLTLESYGPGEWRRVEEVFRSVWPRTGYGMAMEKALALVQSRFSDAQAD